MRLNLLAAAAALALNFGAGTSEASTITCNFVQGNLSNTTDYELSVSGAAACGLEGNDDVAALGSIPGVFAAPPVWTLASKTDKPADGDGFLTLTGLNPTTATGGTWSISAFPDLTQIAVVLKAGNNFAAFLLTPFIDGGSWFSSRGISHASVYYRSCNAGDPGCGVTPTPNVIPLPAAGWLLLAGVGGLAAIRRRRKAA
jgi:hypothetical protein